MERMRSNGVLKSLNVVLKQLNGVLKSLTVVLKQLNGVLKQLNIVLKSLNGVLKILNGVLKQLKAEITEWCPEKTHGVLIFKCTYNVLLPFLRNDWTQQTSHKLVLADLELEHNPSDPVHYRMERRP